MSIKTALSRSSLIKKHHVRTPSQVEIDPRVGPSKVGVENYHAWGGILAIFEVSRGYFLPSKPTQHPREAWGFRRFLWKSGTFYPKQHFFWISPVTLPTRIGLKSSQSSKQHSESNTTRFITLQV